MHTEQKDRNEFIKCPDCGGEVKRKNLNKHRKRYHLPKPAPKPASSKPMLKYMTTAQKRRYLNSLDRPDREWSDDVMDRGRVSLGGGYGLGKNRKH